MLTKRAPTHSPAAGSARESERQWNIFVRIETDFEPQVARMSPKQFVHRLPQEILPGAIDQPKFSLGIERENGDVDLSHDGAQQRGRFERTKTLHAEGFAERVDFEQRLAQSVVLARAACPNRVITFPKCRQQVRRGLPWPNHVLARAEQTPKRDCDNKKGKSPLHFGAVIAEPKQRQRNDCRWHHRPDAQQGEMILMRNAMPQLARSFHICMHNYILACSGRRAACIKHNDISAVAAASPPDVLPAKPPEPKPAASTITNHIAEVCGRTRYGLVRSPP